MGTIQKMIRCKACDRSTMHLVQKPSHILHLLLTVFTLGVWLLVWIPLMLIGQAPECSQCGKKRGPFGL